MTAAQRRRSRRRPTTPDTPDARPAPAPEAPPSPQGISAWIPLSPRVFVPLCLALTALYFAWCAWSLRLHDPPAWPDESLFADPAIHLLRDGHFGTPLLDGYLPGIATRTYWVPPLYPASLAALFAALGSSLAVMRGFSLATGLAALALTHRIARRVGMDPVTACVPAALLAVDGVFLRAARIGRMDLLALALALAAAHEALRDDETDVPAHRGPMFRAGLLAGLASVTHPMGMAALAAVGAHAALSPGRARSVPAVALGAAGPLALWALYIARDPGAFAAQFGAQLARKAARDPWTLRAITASLRVNLEQYADPSRPAQADPRTAVQLVWTLGTAGVVRLAVRSRAALPLALLHGLLAALTLLSLEMWYPVYVAPTAMIGLAAWLGPSGLGAAMRPWAMGAAIAAGLWFGERNVTRQAELRARWEAAGDAARYEPFCAAVSARIPAGARVFVSLFPDLSLCLARRTDLTLRTFLPDGLAVPPARHMEVLRGVDYVVTGRDAPGSLADGHAPRVGLLVAEVGAARPDSYHARIYRMPGATR